MRRLAVFALTVAWAVGLAAQENEPPPPPPATPDYSRQALFQIFADEVVREEAERRFHHQFGSVSFKALGMRWRIGYLPFLMPMPGSQPWLNKDRWPDPFALTGTSIASPPRTWRQSRDMNAELRRIEKRLRETTAVTVKPE